MSLPAIAARAMLEGLELVGLDAEAIRAAAGIADRDLAIPGAHLTDEHFARMWKHAMTLCGRDSLAVEVAQRLPMGSFGIFDYLVASAGTVGEALEALRASFGLVAEGVSLEIDRSHRGCVWVRIHNVPLFEGHEWSDELTLAITLSRLQALAEAPWRAAHVHLARAEVASAARWEQLWGTKVRFGSRASAVCLAEGACAIRLKTADPRLQQALRDVARDHLTSQPSFLLVARTALLRLLRHARATEARLSRELSVSTRSLQRRLRESGTSYRALLDDVRHDEALRLLASREPLARIARTLGFQEQASFTRAFRRWTGRAPSAWLRDTRTAD
ncbi:AraC family transcriptional regulator ligand-binding domain-containing protein [Pendulispora albinea]|uniref:AraC family transcriptional regulator n=1 Tax=Pendulispora albinea TaxID=2741071 RepID=A0ABZ2M1C6_9BACT